MQRYKLVSKRGLFLLLLKYFAYFCPDYNLSFFKSMKNLFLCIALVALSATSCNTDRMGGIPSITVDSIQINGETIKWDIYSPIPVPLHAAVRVFTTLEVSEGTLKSFNMAIRCNEDEEAEETAHLQEMEYDENDVSDFSNNLPEGTLRFKDGVVRTNVAIEAFISSKMKDNDLTFKFYLNTDDQAVKEELFFNVLDEDNDGVQKTM